jgi:hypothetical protein
MSTFTTLNAINTPIHMLMMSIDQQTELSNSVIYKTVESECAYLLARGQQAVNFNTLSATMSGECIAMINDVKVEQDITVHPKDQPSHIQSFNSSLKLIALYSVLNSGFTNAKIIQTAVEGWVVKDNVIFNDYQPNFDTIGSELLQELAIADIIETGSGWATINNKERFEAHGLTTDMQARRLAVYINLVEHAAPKMQPMRHPVRWLHDGTCQLKNFKLVNGKSIPNLDFIESFNHMGHTAYVVNEDMQNEVEDWLTEFEDSLPDTDGLSAQAAARVHQAHADKCVIMNQLAVLPLNIPLYFPHTSDWRGRAYARGGLTQFQSIKACRSVFDFHRTVTVTDNTGLFLHIANVFDKDKLPMVKRIQWVRDNQQSIINGDFTTGMYQKRAELALAQYTTEGTSNIVCHIDGTCNGTQWTAAMYRDEKTAKLVNVTAASHQDDPKDLYGVIAGQALSFLSAGSAEYKAVLEYNRGLGKTVVMVLGYGASITTCEDRVKEYLEDHGNTADFKLITDAIMKAIKFNAPALTKLTTNLKRVLKKTPRNTVSWATPDLIVKQTALDTTHLELHGSAYTGKMFGKAIPDIEAVRRGISPNYVHSLDSAHLRAVVRKAGVELSCIHDSIGAPADKVIEVNELIRTEFHFMNKYDIVENIYSALGARYKQVRGSLDIDEVLQASYIFS